MGEPEFTASRAFLAEAEMLGADSDHQEKPKRVAWLRVSGAGSRRQEDQKRVVLCGCSGNRVCFPIGPKDGGEDQGGWQFRIQVFFLKFAPEDMFLLFSFFKEWGVWGREKHGCEKHPSVASLHAPRLGERPRNPGIYICPGPEVEPATFLVYRMTLQRTQPPRLGWERVLADWSLLAAGTVRALVESVIAGCVGHRPDTRPGSTRRTSSQAADWWEPLPIS